MSQLKIREMPQDERPREKLAAHGAAVLTDPELIAILLRTGIPGANAIEVARKLLKDYGSLSGLSRCTVDELSKMRGVGFAKAVQLVAAFGLGQRLARETLSRQKIDSPELVNELVGPEMRRLRKESLRVILLDTRYHLIRVEEVSIGSVNESIIGARSEVDAQDQEEGIQNDVAEDEAGRQQVDQRWHSLWPSRHPGAAGEQQGIGIVGSRG